MAIRQGIGVLNNPPTNRQDTKRLANCWEIRMQGATQYLLQRMDLACHGLTVPAGQGPRQASPLPNSTFKKEEDEKNHEK